jgi:glycerol-3-phosphate dehydrogenase
MSGFQRLLGTAVPVLGASAAAYTLSGFTVAEARDATTVPSLVPQHAQVPSRAEQLAKLQQGTLQNPIDVRVIGGGATGTGCAVDATTR